MTPWDLLIWAVAGSLSVGLVGFVAIILIGVYSQVKNRKK